MADAIEGHLLLQIQPVFPQLSDRLIRNAIGTVRLNQGIDATLATLLPACIDFLLDTPQDAGNNPHNAGAVNGEENVKARKNDEDEDRFSVTEEKYEFDSDDSLFLSIKEERPTFDTKMRDVKNYLSSSSPSLNSSNSSSSLETSSNHSDEQDGKNNKTEQKFEKCAANGVIIIDEDDLKAENSNEQVNGFKGSNNNHSIIESTEPKIITDPFKETYDKVLAIIPDVEESFALRFLKDNCSGMVNDQAQMANVLVEYLFENSKTYPRIKKEELKLPKPIEKKNKKVKEDVDYFKVVAEPGIYRDPLYHEQCLLLLQNTFRQISYNDLRTALWQHKMYAKAWRHIVDRNKNEGKDPPFQYIKKARNTRPLPAVLHNYLEKEIQFLASHLKKQNEAVDHSLALSLNVKQYEEEGQLIECGCCFGVAVFEEMIQCIEGHLFCSECLRSYAREAIYGTGKMQLFCMTSDCTSSFPLSQLKKALDESTIAKYQERLQDESIKMAELPDLVQCPFCDFAAEMPIENKVFKCQNVDCMQETCRYCKEPWADHFGIPCNEIEKKAETNLRTTYEEKMSMAKIRTCEKCKCGFMKTDGCNKMACRCGTTMCYICRKSSIDYSHFCNHPRDPGKGCTKCKLCSLWTDPTEDDERAVRELKEEAIKEAEKIKAKENQAGPVQIGTKRPLDIGPPEEEFRRKKKKKKHNYNNYHNYYNHHHRHRDYYW